MRTPGCEKNPEIDFSIELLNIKQRTNAGHAKHFTRMIDVNYLERLAAGTEGGPMVGFMQTSAENPEELLKKFVSILPKRKKVAIMCKKGFEKKLKINPTKRYEIYRHKSLTHEELGAPRDQRDV